ncbi:MAG: DUF3047 domain-containing protein [Cyanobacteria bacterium P01_G01_bin.39]
MTTSLVLTSGVNAQIDNFESVTFGESDTKYSVSEQDDKLIINAVGQDSASGLFIIDPDMCLYQDRLSWSWRVEQIQESADITMEDKEDFAAALIVLFGKPGLFSKPKGLIYGFTNTDLPIGSIVASPRAPDNFRTIVLGNRDSPLMNWLENERNIIEDYQLAYGESPNKSLYTIGVFTDNDQTTEPVEAAYDLQSCKLSTNNPKH